MLLPLWMKVVLVIVATTILNRGSGDDRWMKPLHLPGRPLWYTAPLLAGYAALFHHWSVALAFGAAYFFWRLFAWGHLYGLDRYAPNDRPPSVVEKTCLTLARGNPHIAFFIRSLFVVPGLALVAYLSHSYLPLLFSIPFAAAIVGAYELAWRYRPASPIIYAELLTGTLWGILITGG